MSAVEHGAVQGSEDAFKLAWFAHNGPKQLLTDMYALETRT